MGAEPDEKTEAAIDGFRFLFYSLNLTRADLAGAICKDFSDYRQIYHH